MYSAPDFVKVEMNMDDSFATYNCIPIYDQGYHYAFNAEGCEDEQVIDQESTLSGSSPAEYQCWEVEVNV